MASAQREKESLKKHGDAMEQAKPDGNGRGANLDPIPSPERGGHEKSHAAHPGGAVHDNTHRQGSNAGASPGELRQPPQEVGRVGKEHRKQ